MYRAEIREFSCTVTGITNLHDFIGFRNEFKKIFGVRSAKNNSIRIVTILTFWLRKGTGTRIKNLVLEVLAILARSESVERMSFRNLSCDDRLLPMNWKT